MTPNFWCAPINQWSSLFKVVQQMIYISYIYILNIYSFLDMCHWEDLGTGKGSLKGLFFHLTLMITFYSPFSSNAANKQPGLLSNPLTAFSQFVLWRNFCILGIPKKFYHCYSWNDQQWADPILHNTHRSPAQKYSQKYLGTSDIFFKREIKWSVNKMYTRSNNPIKNIFCRSIFPLLLIIVSF